MSERADIVAMTREYANVNWLECSASIIGDPVLRGGRTGRDFAVSEEMSLHGSLHAAKYHAAKDILSLMGEDVSDM